MIPQPIIHHLIYNLRKIQISRFRQFLPRVLRFRWLLVSLVKSLITMKMLKKSVKERDKEKIKKKKIQNRLKIQTNILTMETNKVWLADKIHSLINITLQTLISQCFLNIILNHSFIIANLTWCLQADTLISLNQQVQLITLISQPWT